MSASHEVSRPYPGLRPFEPWEAEIFFGRETHTDRLLEILQREHFLAVIGPSGCGKSSLVRAGLLPTLPLGSIGTGSDWQVAIMRPGNKPLQRLALALRDRRNLGQEIAKAENAPAPDRQITSDVALVEAELRRGPLGLLHVLNDEMRGYAADKRPNLLLLVDQFEEIFTYADAGERQADESGAFINLLLSAKDDKRARIYIALTMRTDFLGNCVRFLPLPDAINRAQYLTPRLTREQTEAAIVGPARMFGGDIERTLVSELINAMSADQDQLPVLQHALARMWKIAQQRNANPVEVGWADLEQAGGVNGALSAHADEVMKELGPDSVEPTEQLFRAITELRDFQVGGQPIRRPRTLGKIAEWSEIGWVTLVPIVQAFSHEDANFLVRPDHYDEGSVIDLSHEALIRQWTRLNQWVGSEARRATEYRRWRERAIQYDAKSGELLAGADLLRALEWRDGRLSSPEESSWKPSAAWASRYSPAAEREKTASEFSKVLGYIEASHRIVLAAEAREKRRQTLLAALAAVSVLAFLIAAWFGAQARKSTDFVEAAGYWMAISPKDERSDTGLEPNEGDTLLRVARARPAIKQQFIDLVFGGDDRALFSQDPPVRRFNSHPSEIFISALGLEKASRERVLADLLPHLPQDAGADSTKGLALALLALEDPDSLGVAWSGYRDEQLGTGLSALLRKVSAHQRERIADILLQSIESTSSSDELAVFGGALVTAAASLPDSEVQALAKKILEYVMHVGDSGQVQVLGQGLASAAARLPADAIANPLKDYIAFILSAQESDRLIVLGNSLAGIASKASPEQALSIAESIAASIEADGRTGRAAALADTLAALASKLPEQAALRAFNAVSLAVGNTIAPEELTPLGRALSALMKELPARDASQRAGTLLAEIEATDDVDQRAVLGDALAAAILQLPAAQTARIVDALLVAIKNAEDDDLLNALAGVLADVAPALSGPQLPRATDALLSAARELQDYEYTVTLWRSLSRLMPTVPVERLPGIAEQILYNIGATIDPDALTALSEAFTASVSRMSSAQRRQLIDVTFNAVEATDDVDQLLALQVVFSTLSENTSADEARKLVERVWSLIDSSRSTDEIWVFGQALVGVAKHLPPEDSRKVATQALDALSDLIKPANGAASTGSAATRTHSLDALYRGSSRGRQLANARLAVMSDALVGLARRLPPRDADHMARKLLGLMLDLEDLNYAAAVSESLTALTPHCSPETASEIADQVFAAISTSSTTAPEPEALEAYGPALQAAMRALSSAHAEEMSERILEELGNTESYLQARALLLGILGAAQRQEACLRCGRTYIEAMKYPGTPLLDLTTAVRKQFPAAPAQDKGFSAFLEWAESSFNAELDASPR